jgi:hypothetical protein
VPFISQHRDTNDGGDDDDDDDDKYESFIVGNNITCTIYCNHRIAATLRTLETWFVSGI